MSLLWSPSTSSKLLQNYFNTCSQVGDRVHFRNISETFLWTCRLLGTANHLCCVTCWGKPIGWCLWRPSRPTTMPHPNQGSHGQSLPQAGASGGPAASPKPGEPGPGSVPKPVPLEAQLPYHHTSLQPGTRGGTVTLGAPSWFLWRPSRTTTMPHSIQGSPIQSRAPSWCLWTPCHLIPTRVAPARLGPEAGASGGPATSPGPGEPGPGSAHKLVPLEAQPHHHHASSQPGEPRPVSGPRLVPPEAQPSHHHASLQPREPQPILGPWLVPLEALQPHPNQGSTGQFRPLAGASRGPAASPQPGKPRPGSAPRLVPLEAFLSTTTLHCPSNQGEVESKSSGLHHPGTLLSGHYHFEALLTPSEEVGVQCSCRWWKDWQRWQSLSAVL